MFVVVHQYCVSSVPFANKTSDLKSLARRLRRDRPAGRKTHIIRPVDGRREAP